MKQVVVLRHLAFEDLGNLAPVLLQNNYSIQMIDAAVSNLELLDPLQADLFIILGGPIAVYEAELYPFLQQEIKMIQARMAKKLPTLGICLGAQLIAAALGAKVYPGKQKEIGWSALTLTEIAEYNFFKHLHASQTQVLHWHGDTFDLPKDATLLASTPICKQQAFSYGENILALQFHPEVLPQYFENWLVGHACELSKANIDVQQLRLETARQGEKLTKHATLFWQAWLSSLE